MTKTQYFTATSVDGYIADADNSLDWLFEVPRNGGSGVEGFGAFFAGVGAMAMGATTYEWVFAHERLDERPEKWREWYGATPTWVFTHRRLPSVADGDIRFVEGDVRPMHDEMVAAADGRNVWLVGGGELVGAFAGSRAPRRDPARRPAGVPRLGGAAAPAAPDVEARPARLGETGRAAGAARLLGRRSLSHCGRSSPLWRLAGAPGFTACVTVSWSRRGAVPSLRPVSEAMVVRP